MYSWKWSCPRPGRSGVEYTAFSVQVIGTERQVCVCGGGGETLVEVSPSCGVIHITATCCTKQRTESEREIEQQGWTIYDSVYERP